MIVAPSLPSGEFADTVEVVLQGRPQLSAAPNTTIGVIWTDARLDKVGCNRVASVAHNGLARTIRPVHTPYDGDTLFVLSIPAPEAPPADLLTLCVAASEVVARAVVRAVSSA